MARDEGTITEPGRARLDDIPEGAVVAAVDGSPRDGAVVDWAADQAVRCGRALRVLHVVEPGIQLTPYEAVLGDVPQLAEELDAEANRVLDIVRERVTGRYPPRSAGPARLDLACVVGWGSPATVLVEASSSASWVVVGAPAKRGLQRVLIGSVAIATVAHSRCPVAVVPANLEVTPLERVVVAVDGSEASAHAAEAAFATADSAGASVTGVIAWNIECVDGVVVTEPGSQRWLQVEHKYEALARRVLDPAAARHSAVPFEVLVRHAGAAHAATEVVAEQRAGVLVVGGRGRGGFAGLRLGSTSRRLVEQAGTVVAVVR
jgi:nucleotide-binding universal stress UspA family protein